MSAQPRSSHHVDKNITKQQAEARLIVQANLILNFKRTGKKFNLNEQAEIRMTFVEHVGYDVGLNVFRCRADILESTHKGVNQRPKDVTQTQQQRPEWPTVTFTLHA